ncbi:MAG: hypothetical protein SO065_12245, partial [Lawsonibacter sp.]|nr:hypothetical protein [Lawsonibacter sp.]
MRRSAKQARLYFTILPPKWQPIFPNLAASHRYLQNWALHFLKIWYNTKAELNIWACSAVGSAKGSVFCHIYNFTLLYSSVPLLELLIWAYSSAGSAKGSVFCHTYNFILLYSSVPLLELLIWAYSSAGSAKGSVFCHTYNFILLYSSVPL